MKHAALIVVDVQCALVSKHPYMEERFIRNLQTLIPACRSIGVEVIYIRHDDGPGSGLEYGSAGHRIYSAVAPAEGERVFDKRFNSAFRETGLREYLQKKGIQTLVLTGMQTEYCVDATCKVAFEYGYELLIPRNSTTTFGNPLMNGKDMASFYEDHIWDNRFARVLPVTEVLALLSGEPV